MMIVTSKSENLLDKRAALKSLYKVVNKKMFKQQILEALLVNGYELEIYEFDLFESYLEKPTSICNYFSEKGRKAYESSDSRFDQVLNYRSNVVVQPNINQVIEAHLKDFLKDEKKLKSVSKYFDEQYLLKLILANRVLQGGDIKDYKDKFGQFAAEELENRRTLEFATSTKRSFKRGEDVQLTLKVKNIPKLICKVFQVDTAQYYMQHNKELDEMIDLDGIVPAQTLEFNFDYPKQKLHDLKINLDQVKQKDYGVFVVDISGSTNACRIIIRKGTLQMLPLEHFQGIGMYLIDETKQICKGKGSGILIEGKFHPCDDKGQVLFPFGTEAINDKSVILVHNGFAFRSTISIPTEVYNLFSHLLINQEGLVCDQVNKLIIRNQLFLNSVPITMKKASRCDVTIETKNAEGISNFREYKSLQVSDDEDLCVDFTTPKFLSTLKVTVSFTLFDLRGKEVVLSKSHDVAVNRGQGSNVYCTPHLRFGGPNGRHLSIAVVGKNGEPSVGHYIKIDLLKSFGMYDHEFYLYTDKDGVATLGELEDFKFLQVECVNQLFPSRLFSLPNVFDSIDIPNLIQITVGEKLLLPALNQKLSRDVFEFAKIGSDPSTNEKIILQDAYENLKQEENHITLQGMPKGEYTFRYNLFPRRSILVVVHEGNRWQSNPLILEQRASITQLRKESRFLTINSVNRVPGTSTVTLGISSNNPNIRAHIFAYHYSKQPVEEPRKPLATTEVTSIKQVTNSILANRVLSDELQYIQNRRTAETISGCTIDKPCVLFHREKIRETKDDEEIVKTGKGFEADHKKEIIEGKKAMGDMEMIKDNRYREVLMTRDRESSKNYNYADEDSDEKCVFMSAEPTKKTSLLGGIRKAIGGIFPKDKPVFTGVSMSCRPKLAIRKAKVPSSLVVLNNMDYSKRSGDVVANVKSSASGQITVDLNQFKGYSRLYVVVTDIHGAASVEIPLGSNAPEKVDLRVKEVLKAGTVRSIEYDLHASSKQESELSRPQGLQLDGLSNAETLLIEDLQSLSHALMNIVGPGINRAEAIKWQFILNWDILKHEQKLDKWESFGGVELATFIAVRDREFFDSHVRPLLKMKAKQTLEDKLLIGFGLGDKQRLSLEELGDNLSTMPHQLSPLALLLCKPTSDLLKWLESVVESESETLDTAVWQSIIAGKESKSESTKDGLTSPNANLRAPIVHVSSTTSKAVLLDDFEGGEGYNGNDKKEKKKKKNMRQDKIENYSLKESAFDSGFISMPEGTGKKNEDDGGSEEEVDDMTGRLIIDEYKKPPPATEYKERQEYFKESTKSLKLNRFWVSLIKNAANSEASLQGINWLEGTKNLLSMTTSNAELIYALTFARVPLTKGTKLANEQTSNNVKVISNEPFLLVAKSTKVNTNSKVSGLDVIISQKLYDPNDKFTVDVNDPQVKTLKCLSTFLLNRIYECRLTISNMHDSSVSIDLNYQLPVGSLPVKDLRDVVQKTLQIDSMNTSHVTFSFYFPEIGTYPLLPAYLSKNGQLISSAKVNDTIKVVSEYSEDEKPPETLQSVLTDGTSQAILTFLKNDTKPISESVAQIRWIAKTTSFKDLIKSLRQQLTFDEKIWSYAIYHGEVDEFRELMRAVLPRFVQKYHYIRLPAGFEPMQAFEPLEYDPLVNPRAHEIGDKHNTIRNVEFRETYQRFLYYCCEKKNLDPTDWLIMSVYLAMQDRVLDSEQIFKKIDVAEIKKSGKMELQYDYLAAYMSIRRDYPGFSVARETVKKYSKFMDLTWRERFNKLQRQIEEFDTGKTIQSPIDFENSMQKKTNQELAEKSEFLKVEKSGKQSVSITYRSIDRLKVKFFKFDVELLFSKDPFQEERTKGVACVSPNYETKHRVATSDNFKTTVIEVPEHLRNDCLVVEVCSRDKTDSVEVFAASLLVHLQEAYGIVSVNSLEGSALPGCYVKVYRKDAGTIKFHKDGYTDFRGCFDYASLGSGLTASAEFSLLVLHTERGAVTLKAKSPLMRVASLRKETDDSTVDPHEAEELCWSTYEQCLRNADFEGVLE